MQARPRGQHERVPGASQGPCSCPPCGQLLCLPWNPVHRGSTRSSEVTPGNSWHNSEGPAGDRRSGRVKPRCLARVGTLSPCRQGHCERLQAWPCASPEECICGSLHPPSMPAGAQWGGNAVFVGAAGGCDFPGACQSLHGGRRPVGLALRGQCPSKHGLDDVGAARLGAR